MSEAGEKDKISEADANASPSPAEILSAIECLAIESVVRASRANRRLLTRLGLRLAWLLLAAMLFLYFVSNGYFGGGRIALLWLALWCGVTYFFGRDDFEELFWLRQENRQTRRKLVKLYAQAHSMRVERPLSITMDEAEMLWREYSSLEDGVSWLEGLAR